MTQSGFAKSNGSEHSQSTKNNGVIATKQQEDNNLFLYSLGLLIGGVAEILTKAGERFEGIFSAYSSSNELMFEAAHRVNDVENEKITEHYDVLIVPSDRIVDIKFKNIEVSSACKEKEFQTDAAIVEKSRSFKVGDKELTPWEGDEDDDGLELNGNSTTSNGWEVHDMFKQNEEKYGVVSSFKQDLSGYTTQVDQTDDSFKKHEQKALEIAEEIQRNSSSFERSQMENADDEEEAFSAVVRPTTTTTIIYNNTKFTNNNYPSSFVESGKYVVPSRRHHQVAQLSNSPHEDKQQQVNGQQPQSPPPQKSDSQQQEPHQVPVVGQQQQNCTVDPKTDTSTINNNTRGTPPIYHKAGTPPINNNKNGTPPIHSIMEAPPSNNNNGTPPINNSNNGTPPINNTSGHVRSTTYNQSQRGYNNGRYVNSYDSYDRQQRGYNNSRGRARPYQRDYSNGGRQNDDNASRQNVRGSNAFQYRRGGRGGREGDDRSLRNFGETFHLKGSSSNPPRVRTPQNKSPSPPAASSTPPPGSENDVIAANNSNPPPPPPTNSDLQSHQISSTQSADNSETKDAFSLLMSPAVEPVPVPALVRLYNSGSEGSFDNLTDTSSSSPSPKKPSASPSITVNQVPSITPEFTRSVTTENPAVASRDVLDCQQNVAKRSKKVPFKFNPNVKDFRPSAATMVSQENSQSAHSSASSTPVPQIPPCTPTLPPQQTFVYSHPPPRFATQPPPGLSTTVPAVAQQQTQYYFLVPGLPGQGGVPQQVVSVVQPRMLPVVCQAEGGGAQVQYYVHNPLPHTGGHASNNCSSNQNAVPIQGPIYGQGGDVTNGTRYQFGYTFPTMPMVGCAHRPPPQFFFLPQQQQHMGGVNSGMQQHNQQQNYGHGKENYDK